MPDPPPTKGIEMANGTCSVDGCDRPVRYRGWCGLHHKRWWAHGDVLWEPPTSADRFFAKVNKTDACWLWTASLNNRGYGQFGVGRRLVLAHRWSYEWHNGPIPAGLHLDHLCRVRNCVRPDHLEPVTNRENNRRGDTGAHERAKTHCPQGHPYDETNTYSTPGVENSRACRECMRRRMREYRLRLKERASDA